MLYRECAGDVKFRCEIKTERRRIPDMTPWTNLPYFGRTIALRVDVQFADEISQGVEGGRRHSQACHLRASHLLAHDLPRCCPLNRILLRVAILDRTILSALFDLPSVWLSRLSASFRPLTAWGVPDLCEEQRARAWQ